MARKPRVEYPGAFYHVISRGNNKQVIFQDEQDYRVYITRIGKYHEKYKFIIYAFVLMPNHIHLLIETISVPLSKIMQGLQQSYALYFHNKYKSVGHVFQGRYKAIVCERDSYLLELVRYIHLNPVRAGLTRNLNDYPWSSHQTYLGKKKHTFVEKSWLMNIISEDKASAIEEYSNFILSGIDKEPEQRFYEVVDQRLLGSSEFIEEILQKTVTKEEKRQKAFLSNKSYNGKKVNMVEMRDILEAISEITGISPQSILSESRERAVSDARSIFAYVAVRYTGFTSKALAKYLQKEESSVSNIIHRVESKKACDSVFHENLERIIKIIKLWEV